MPREHSSHRLWKGAIPVAALAGAVVVFVNVSTYSPFVGWFKPASGWFYPVLRSCQEYTNVFASPVIIGESGDAIDQITQEYHDNLERVLQEYVPGAEDEVKPLNPQCTAENPHGLLPNTPLETIASKLPPWNAGETEGKLSGPVLLEYLHAYECALINRSTFLALFVRDDELVRWAGNPNRPLDAGRFGLEFWDQLAKIPAQVRKERLLLSRMQPLLAGLDRVRLLDGELTCLTRGSLDVRNAFALSAEISSCLPRVWNAKDPLRDTQNPKP